MRRLRLGYHPFSHTEISILEKYLHFVKLNEEKKMRGGESIDSKSKNLIECTEAQVRIYFFSYDSNFAVRIDFWRVIANNCIVSANSTI
jgi:hypothetical protein